MELPKSDYLLYIRGTEKILSAMECWYPKVSFYCMMAVLITDHLLYAGVTQKSVSAKSSGHPEVIICYIVGLRKNHYLVYSTGQNCKVSLHWESFFYRLLLQRVGRKWLLVW